MVGWGFAFGRGFVVLLWSIVWAIVAGIVGVLVIGGSLASLVSNPTAVASNPTGIVTGFLAASFLGIFPLIFIAVNGLTADTGGSRDAEVLRELRQRSARRDSEMLELRSNPLI